MADQRIARKTFKFRLYPTKAQTEALTFQLSEACRLYNAALQERRDAWRLEHKSISLYDQTYQLKEILNEGHSEIQGFSAAWHILDRVDKSFKAFFRRVKRREKAGFPRFKSAHRFDSFDFQANAQTIKDGKLRIPSMGLFKLKLHRPVGGVIKHCHVKRRAGRWYACFSVECESKPLPEISEQVGIDVGLLSFATLSDGTSVDNPRYHREAQKRLRVAQRKVSRRKKGSNGRRKAVQLLQRAHVYVHNQRADFHHKISRWLVNNYGMIAAEDLNVRGMVKNHNLAKSISDAGWSQFLNFIAYKAEEAGRRFFRVNPSGTSQYCCNCGHKQVKSLQERTHTCDSCGVSLDRDHNAAINILRAGIALAALTCPTGESVAAENTSAQAPARKGTKKKSLTGGCLRTTTPNASG